MSEISIGRMPRFQKSIRLEAGRDAYYAELLEQLPAQGFTIEAQSSDLKRLSVRDETANAECGCLYVIWIYSLGPRARVIFGVKPRFMSFFRCRTGDVYAKLLGMEAVLRAAAQTAQAIEDPASGLRLHPSL